LKPETVRALEEIAGPNLEGSIEGPQEIGVGVWPAYARGVYVVFDAWDNCVYVGKVCSATDSERLQSRFSEHLSDPVKLNSWHHYYVLPMKDKATNAYIEKTEGWVARHLRPTGSQRSPNPRRARRRIRR
jgi:hypothetical protein